jgi:hypothetical protein
VACAIAHWESRGGKWLILSTGNPVAAKMYGQMGFVELPADLQGAAPGEAAEAHISLDEGAVSIGDANSGDPLGLPIL